MKFKKVLLAALLLICCLAFVGCGNRRKTVSMDKFQEMCKIESLEEIDTHDYTDSYKGIQDIYGGRLAGGDLQAVYMNFENKDQALALYQDTSDAKKEDVTCITTILDGDNFLAATFNSDSYYIRMIIVDNMLIEVKGSKTYKAEIDKIISQFGNYPVSAV